MAPDLKSFFRTLLRSDQRAMKPKPIQAQDPSKPSLARLSYDILILIVKQLYETERQSVNNLALTCSALYSQTRYVQHRVVSLDFRQLETTGNRMKLVRNGFLLAIRRLHVRTSPSFDNALGWLNTPKMSKGTGKRLKSELALLDELGDIIPSMPGLRDLHWSSAVIPGRLLGYLGKNPRVLLHLSLEGRFGLVDDEDWAALRELSAKLAGIQGISSLRIRISGRPLPFRPIVEHALKPILLSSPRLRTLSLNIDTRQSSGHFREYHGFGLCNGETLPPLEELEVVNYQWGQQPWGIDLGEDGDGYPVPFGTEFEYWAEHFDWSQLRRLRLEDDSVFLAVHLAPQLTALEELELSFPSRRGHDSIPAFFAALPLPPTLTSLTLSTLPPTILPLLPATLRSLSVHQTPLPDAELTLLREHLPNLETLARVCACDPDWPRETLALLTTFPRLHTLTISFDRSTPGRPGPALTLSAAGQLRAELANSSSSSLRSLRLHSSLRLDPRLDGWDLTPDEIWLGRMGMEFECDLDGNEDGRDQQGPLSLGLLRGCRCAGFSEGENERLRAVAAGVEVMTEQEAEHFRFVVALRGPVSQAEWKVWREGGWKDWDWRVEQGGGHQAP